jgi:hypothetical protein
MVSCMRGSMVFGCTWASTWITTGPPRFIIPQTGDLSFSSVPRPPCPLRRRRRPVRPLGCTSAGCPFWPAITEASSHSTSLERLTAGFFYHATTQRSRHLIGITLMDGPRVGHGRIRHLAPHTIQPQDPHLQRLMMSSNDGVGPIITTVVTVVTCLALTSGFRVLTAPLHHLLRLPSGTHQIPPNLVVK